MEINTSATSLGATSYAQLTGATQPSTPKLSSTGADSVKLSATAEAAGYHQQGFSVSQIASLMGVSPQTVDGYLYITPTTSTGSVAHVASGSEKAAATTPSSSSSSRSSSSTGSKPVTSVTSKPVTTSVTTAPKLKAA